MELVNLSPHKGLISLHKSAMVGIPTSLTIPNTHWVLQSMQPHFQSGPHGPHHTHPICIQNPCPSPNQCIPPPTAMPQSSLTPCSTHCNPAGTMGRTIMAPHLTACTHQLTTTSPGSMPHHPVCERHSGPSLWIWHVCLDHPSKSGPVVWQRIRSSPHQRIILQPSRGLWYLHPAMLLWSIHPTLPTPNPDSLHHPCVL